MLIFEMPIVNFEQITDNGRITYLSGKNKGLAARQTLNLEQSDKNDEIYQVVIPESVDCNESFLSGVFSNSITFFKTRSAFLNKYQFENISALTEECLNNVITATLSEGTALSSLKR